MYYRPDCKDCTKAKAKKWAEANPKKVKASKIKYNKSPNGQKSALLNGRRRLENGEYIKWLRNNKDKVRQYRLNRVSNKKHKIPKEEWIRCKEYFNFSCAYCGMTEVEHKNKYNQQLHKEHVIHDGRDDIKNCVSSCKICNSCKNISSLNNWYNTNNINYSRERYLKIYNWIRYDSKSR